VQFELKLEQSATFLSRHVPVLDHETNVRTTRGLSIPGPRTVVATIDPSAIDIDATFALLHDDTPLFSLLVVVKRQAVFWQEHLTALKAEAIATGGRWAAPA
jgi:hypothetical protein